MSPLGKLQNALVENYPHTPQVLIVRAHHCYVHAAVAQASADLCKASPTLELPSCWQYSPRRTNTGRLYGFLTRFGITFRAPFAPCSHFNIEMLRPPAFL